MMIQCPFCGKRISDSDEKCDYCEGDVKSVLLKRASREKHKEFVFDYEDPFEEENVCVELLHARNDITCTLSAVGLIEDEKGIVLVFNVENRNRDSRRIYIKDLRIDDELIKEYIYVGEVAGKEEFEIFDVPLYGYIDTYYTLSFSIESTDLNDVKTDSGLPFPIEIEVDFDENRLNISNKNPYGIFFDYFWGFRDFLEQVLDIKAEPCMNPNTRELMQVFFIDKNVFQTEYDYEIELLSSGELKFCTFISTEYSVDEKAYVDNFFDNAERNSFDKLEYKKASLYGEDYPQVIVRDEGRIGWNFLELADKSGEDDFFVNDFDLTVGFKFIIEDFIRQVEEIRNIIRDPYDE